MKWWSAFSNGGGSTNLPCACCRSPPKTPQLYWNWVRGTCAVRSVRAHRGRIIAMETLKGACVRASLCVRAPATTASLVLPVVCSLALSLLEHAINRFVSANPADSASLPLEVVTLSDDKSVKVWDMHSTNTDVNVAPTARLSLWRDGSSLTQVRLGCEPIFEREGERERGGGGRHTGASAWARLAWASQITSGRLLFLFFGCRFFGL